MSTTDNKWTYVLKTNAKGSYLIEEYKKYDSVIDEAQGYENPDVDLIVYLEETSYVDFGQIFLIKMSKVMIQKYGGLSFWDKWQDLGKLSKNLIESLKKAHPNLEYAIPESNVAHEAFNKEIAYRSIAYGLDPIQQQALESVNKMTAEDYEFINSLRALKFTPEQYDPTINPDKYLLKSVDTGLIWLQHKAASIENQIKGIKKQLETWNYFPLIDLDFIISFFDKLLKFAAKLQILIKKLKKYINEGFPVICGIVNGLIEFVAGIMEVITLIVFRPLNLAEKDLFEHIELEYDMLVELLEEIVELFIEDPDKILNTIEEQVENYWTKRYKNKKINIYQHNYYIGEDIVMAIDLVLTVVTVVKGLTKVSQKLPKFTQWIDDVLRGKAIRERGFDKRELDVGAISLELIFRQEPYWGSLNHILAWLHLLE